MGEELTGLAAGATPLVAVVVGVATVEVGGEENTARPHAVPPPADCSIS